jgi:lipid-A-disaccharide synthase
LKDSKTTVVIVAGESSGDLYGAKLVEAMASVSPHVEFYGIGGGEMERSGVKLLCSSSDLAVVGLTEVLEKIGHIWRAWKQMKRFIFKDSAVPVLYYVSPQVWAWRSGRIKKIAKRVTKMAVILPFETTLYQKENVDVEFVGHPLLDILDNKLTREEARRRLGVPTGELLIGLLPGSRGREVKVLLPSLVGAAEILRDDFPAARFMIPLAPTIKKEAVQEFTEKTRLSLDIIEDKTFEVMKAADLLLVVSGTATLEGAIAGVPMIIIYRLSPLSYIVGRMLVKVPCIGLANIVVGRKVVPELIQDEVTPERIAHEAKKILRDRTKRQKIESEFKRVTEKLGGTGASQRVARIALRMIGTL